ncbi:MAG TPA: polysaccharide biosynthesis/export family protein, partial [Planctomycetota bacterium]|nr:polysaccharide biosynthesis/export family protein [Planctomycetota bacterium]
VTRPAESRPVAPSLARALSLAVCALLALALPLGLGACRSSPDRRILSHLVTDGFGNRYTGNAEEENYLRIGDQFQWLDEANPDKLPLTQSRVDIDGTIVIPQVGAVAVAGLSRTEIEAHLTQKLAPYFERTEIRVLSITTSFKVYFIYGEINNAGQRQFQGDVTIFEAVMQAGIKPYSSNLGRVRLIRADPVDPLIITVNIRDILQYGDTSFNVLVQERDIIVVPPTFLAQIGNFLSALTQPFIIVFNQISLGIFQIQRFDNYSNNNNIFQ